VPVGIDGDLNGVVSSLLLDIAEGFPVPDEPRGVRVSQIMEPNRPEARLPETRKKSLAEVLREDPVFDRLIKNGR